VVVIAEDDQTMLGLISKILIGAGLTLSKTFDKGEDFAEFVTKNTNVLDKPSLVVTDYQMSIMDGLQGFNNH
jgi:CheY-like chemotaxis protein